MPTVKVGDVNIYYEVHGKGETLVLITFYTANTSWWFRQVPVFSQQYHVVAFDNRGSGQSDKPDMHCTMEMMSKMTEHLAPLHGAIRQAHAIWGHDIYERLPEIKVPTLIIAGDAERLIPVENSRILASRIPGAKLVILKNMGHGFIIEAADEANRAVLDFLRRHRKPG